MPIETFPNNGSADKAGKWKERELQIFNPSPSESNLGDGKKKVKILPKNTLSMIISWQFWNCQINTNLPVNGKVFLNKIGVACTLSTVVIIGTNPRWNAPRTMIKKGWLQL